MITSQATSLERGRLYFHRGEYKRAAECFGEMLAGEAENAWALAHRAECFFHMGALDRALKDFDRALEIRPDYAWAHGHRGVCLRALGRFEDALQSFNEALALQPEKAWTLVHRGNMNVALGFFQAAMKDLDRALKIDPDIISHAQGERGLIFNAMGRFEEGMACCEGALSTDPEDVIALYSFAVARANVDGLEASRQDLVALRERFLKKDPKCECAALIYRRAGLTALVGEHDDALTLLTSVIEIEEYREIAKHDPAWSRFWETTAFIELFPQKQFPARARIWSKKGNQARQDGRLDEALTCYDKAIGYYPNCARTLAQRAELKRLKGLFQEALDDFDRAIQLRSNVPWTLAHRGAVHRMRRQWTLAASDFDRALALRPDYAWALGYRSLIYEFMGDFQSCLNLFEEALRLSPDLFPDQYSERAVLLCQLGHYTEARQQAEKAVACDPDKALAYYTRAVVEGHLANADSVRTHITRARKILEGGSSEPNPSVAAYRLVGLHVLEGQFPRALDLLKRVLDADESVYELALLDPVWNLMKVDKEAYSKYSFLTKHQP